MSEIVEQVWGRKYSEKQSSALLIHRKFYERLDMIKNGKMNLEKKLESCTNNFYRIEEVKEFYEWFPFPESTVKKYEKSEAVASEFRKRGNEFYKIKKFDEALRAYNLALMFATSEGQELGTSYGNRSALFTQIQKPLLALQDIKRAFRHGYPEHLKPKLLERKYKCFNMLKLDDSDTPPDKIVVDLLRAEDEKLDEEEEKRYNFCKEKLFQLQNKNPLITSAEDFVKIEDNEERGRHVVVTKDVPPGILLIVDHPFSKVLLKEVTWDLDHCHNCHERKCDSGVPCPHCVFAFYCGTKCLEEAWKKSHQYECQCGPHLHLIKSPRTVLLVFRIICTLGPATLWDMFQSRESGPTTPQETTLKMKDRILGADENNVYNSAIYLPIHNLIYHPTRYSHPELISYCLTSIILVNILEYHSPFFDNIKLSDTLVKFEFLTFVASIILLHMQNLPCNAHSLNELVNIESKNGKELTPDVVRNAFCSEYGAGAFALLSLINHSCDPNVYRINLYSGHTAVLTIRSLKAGDEILDNYGSHYALDEISLRRKHLYDNYYFECTCLPCSKSWPLLHELKERKEVFVCPKCKDFKLVQRCNPEYIENCVFNNGRTQCGKCGTNHEASRLADLSLMIDQFFCTYDSVLYNQPLLVVDKLIECLSFFENNLLPPFIRINDTQETLKQAWNLIVHFSKFKI